MKSPFKFLDAFTAGDKNEFFGRDQESAQLHYLVQKTPLLLLYGLSGTGKTSLVQCGLSKRFDGTDWLPILIRRRGDINAALQHELGQLLFEVERDLPVVEQIKRLYSRYLRPVYLIFDQFEELIILNRDEAGDEQQKFAQTLRTLVQPGMPCSTILVIREEYIGALSWLEREIPTLFDHRMRVEQMRDQKVKMVLRESFKAFNITAAPSEDACFNEIIKNVGQGRSGIELPYLQVYLDALYRADYARSEQAGALQHNDKGLPALTFTQTEIQQFGDMDEVLDRFLTEQQNNIGQTLRAEFPDLPDGVVQRILGAFVTEDGTKRPVAYQLDDETIVPEKAFADELPGLPGPALSKAIRALEKARLLRLDERGIELAHDSLAALIDKRRGEDERRRIEAKRVIHQAYREWTAKRGGYLTRKQLKAFKPYIPDLALPDEVRDYIEKSRTQQRILTGIYAGTTLLVAALGLLALFNYLENQQIKAEHARKNKIAYYVAQARAVALTNPTAALDTLKQAIPLGGDSAALAAFADIYAHNEFYKGVLPHPAPVSGAEFLRDGSPITWTENAVYRWSAEGALLDSLPGFHITSAALSPDKTRLAMGDSDGMLTVFDPGNFRDARLDSTLCHIGPIRQIEFTRDGQKLYTAGTDGLIREIELSGKINAGRMIAVLPPSTRGKSAVRATPTALCYHDSLKTLIFGATIEFEMLNQATGKPKTTTLHNVGWYRNGRVQYLPYLHDDEILSIAPAPNGKAWVSADRTGVLKFWDAQLNLVATLKAHEGRINQVKWSPDSRRLFSAGSDRVLKCWSPEGNLITTYKAHRDFVLGVAVSDDGLELLTAGEDSLVYRWNTESRIVRRYGPHPDGVSGIATSTDGRLVLTAADAGRSLWGDIGNDPGADFEKFIQLMFTPPPRSAYLWEAATGRLIRELKGQTGGMNAVAMDPAGTLLLSANDDGSVMGWSPSGDSLFRADLAPEQITCLAISPDGRLFAAGDNGGGLHLCDRQGKPVATLPKQPSLVSAAAFAPDGDRLLAACFDGWARLYDLQGRPLDSFGMAEGPRLTAAGFSPDKRYLVLGKWGGEVEIIHLQDRASRRFTIESKNKTGGSKINALAFSPDGRYVAFGAEGGLAQVYRLDEAIPRPLFSFQHYPRWSILSLAFTPDGRELITGCGDGWARVWKLKL